jgi:hypothetical protein
MEHRGLVRGGGHAGGEHQHDHRRMQRGAEAEGEGVQLRYAQQVTYDRDDRQDHGREGHRRVGPAHPLAHPASAGQEGEPEGEKRRRRHRRRAAGIDARRLEHLAREEQQVQAQVEPEQVLGHHGAGHERRDQRQGGLESGRAKAQGQQSGPCGQEQRAGQRRSRQEERRKRKRPADAQDVARPYREPERDRGDGGQQRQPSDRTSRVVDRGVGHGGPLKLWHTGDYSLSISAGTVHRQRRALPRLLA